MKCHRLFLDVEWANYESNPILQIGAIVYDDQYKVITELYSVVRPDSINDIPETSLSLMHLSAEQLELANPIEIVLKKFNQRFKLYDEIIIWNKKAYEILENAMNANGFNLKKHRIVVLQDLLSDIFKMIGFQKSLKQFGVKHKQERLHCSKYDVLYLKALYQVIEKEYSEYYHWKNNLKFYQSLHSKIIHSENCVYVNRMCMENKIKTYPEKVFDGYKICRCCKADFIFERTKSVCAKAFKDPFRDEFVYEMCNHLGLKCMISDNVIFIKTSFSNWRIFHNNEEVTNVYHENNRKDLASERRKTIKHGFHKQNINSTNLYSVLKYIRKHDKQYLCHKNKHRKRIDSLFELIAKEND